MLGCLLGGVGLVLSPANTDALNRVPRSRYGEATGITQTVRNFGSSLGLAVLGTVLILQNKSNLESTLGEEGIPKSEADQIAESLSEAGVRLRALLAHGLLRDGGGDGRRLLRGADLDAVGQGAGFRRLTAPDPAGRGRREAE